MATLNWPSGLPDEFMMNSYREAIPDGRIRDNFETGPAGVRRRSTATAFVVQGSMRMTTAEWETLKNFCDVTLLNMSLAFGFPEQGSSSPGEWLVRFVDPPVRSPLGIDWQVDLQLEVLPS